MKTWRRLIFYTFLLKAAVSSASDNKFIRNDHKSLKKSYKELIQQGHRLYEEGALPEALIRYEKASQLKSKISPNLRYRLASLYYLLDADEKVIDLLKHRSTLNKIPETYYLLGLCYKDLEQFDFARSSFRKYLDKDNIKKRNEALYELAEIEFKSGNIDKSATLLCRLAEDAPDRQVMLALAKVLIRQGNFDRAERLLRENVFHESELNEYAYLMGEIAVNRGQYKEAFDFFCEAQDRLNPSQCHADLLDSQLQALLVLADDFKLEAGKRIEYWRMLGRPLKELAKRTMGQNMYLAHYYLVTHNLLGDPVCKSRANALLDRISSFDGKDKVKALFLQARLALTYEEKDRLFRLITAENIHNPYVLKGWYLRGMNDLEYGLKHEKSEILNRACYEFEIVWKRCLTTNRHLAGLALKSHIQALLARKTKKSHENALKLINEVLSQSDLNIPNRDEILYLRGLAGMGVDPDSAVDSLLQAIDYGATPAAKEALFSLAVWHYQNKQWEKAENRFTELVQSDGGHAKSPEALFFAAECVERQNKDASNIKKELFEKFPRSPFAAKAYLNYYPRQLYIQGHPEAVEHLTGIPDRFPDSPWRIEAGFLLGLDLKRDHRTSSGKLSRPKDLEGALAWFQDAESTYSSLSAAHLIPEEQEQYFYTLRCHAVIERALTCRQIAENSKGTKKRIYLEYAKDLLRKVIHDFHQNSRLVDSDPYPALLEESQYHLAKSHINMNEDCEAEEILSEMRKKYQKYKITRGYYLSLVYYDLAMIAKRKGMAEEALEKLRKAEDAAKGRVITSDQLLDIWIQQSLCYLDLDDNKTAMKILSQAINQDVASTQRLKAMYLRSSIYESQGRKELALRQLEALAKQQGEWASKAKEKLQAYD
jgi:tetratricopeptide (TPR) repeat protein